MTVGFLSQIQGSSAGSIYIEESPPSSLTSGKGYHRITLTDPKGKPSAIPLGAAFDYVVFTNRTHLSATATYNNITYSAVPAIGSYWSQVSGIKAKWGGR